jgi:hypothetical protein
MYASCEAGRCCEPTNSANSTQSTAPGQPHNFVLQVMLALEERAMKDRRGHHPAHARHDRDS